MLTGPEPMAVRNRPLSAESVLASISGMSLVGWQLLIANMWWVGHW